MDIDSRRQPPSPPDGDPWPQLPFRNQYGSLLKPGASIGRIATAVLLPQWLVFIYALLPRHMQRRLPAATEFILLLAFASAVAFLIFLFIYRTLRKRRQRQFNASLAAQVPAHFVLYLRSFRRTGAIAVLNQLPTLAERRLMGDFWDVELALSVCLSDKLPLVSMGVKADGYGSGQLQCDDASWRDAILALARSAQAIFLVLDDRPSTVWEFETIMADATLRQKLVLMMAPEQYGWRRRYRRLPTVAASWEAVRAHVAQRIALPAYVQAGALLTVAADTGRFTVHALGNFDRNHVQRVVASAIVQRTAPAIPMETRFPIAPYREAWHSYVDPVWPIVYVLACGIGALYTAARGTELVLFAAWAASLAVAWQHARAFTLTNPQHRNRPWLSWWRPSVWLSLGAAPKWVRAAIDGLCIFTVLFFTRSMIAEPYTMPSSAMWPTLQAGDFIVVNKMAYALYLPLTRQPLLTFTPPQRGDVIVFPFPLDRSQDYVQRIVGLPGDAIVYRDKRLTINGGAIAYRSLAPARDADTLLMREMSEEFLAREPHRIATSAAHPDVHREQIRAHPHQQACTYSDDAMRCTVPAGHYFVLGDARDVALDSRYWGFVPAPSIVGRVQYVWANFRVADRVGPVR